MEEISIFNCLIPDSYLYKVLKAGGTKLTNKFLTSVSLSTSVRDLFFSSGHQDQVLHDTSLWAHNRAFIMGAVQVTHTGPSPAKTLVQKNWYTLENAGIELAAAQPSASWENVTWPANVWFTSLELNKTTAITDSKTAASQFFGIPHIKCLCYLTDPTEIALVRNHTSFYNSTASQKRACCACWFLTPFPLFLCSISCHSSLFLSNKKSEVFLFVSHVCLKMHDVYLLQLI